MGVAPAASNGDVEMAESAETGTLPENIVKQIDETHEKLSVMRKKRKVPAGYVKVAAVKTFTAKHTIPSLHSSLPSLFLCTLPSLFHTLLSHSLTSSLPLLSFVSPTHLKLFIN